MGKIACLAVFAFYSAAAWAQADPALLAKLRQGGYVLFLRHTSTDFSQNDQKMTSYEDCPTQRNLTDKGRDEARALGAAIKRLEIPIGTVYASPFCRTQETARLAFGRAERTNEARGAPGGGQEQRPQQPRQPLLRRVRPALSRRRRNGGRRSFSVRRRGSDPARGLAGFRSPAVAVAVPGMPRRPRQ